jgi:hypothetical protein
LRLLFSSRFGDRVVDSFASSRVFVTLAVVLGSFADFALDKKIEA